jgi:DNA-binding MarR family transcriptional regulator
MVMDDYPSIAIERLKEMSNRYGSGVLQRFDRYTSGESFLLRLLSTSDESVHPSDLKKRSCISSARVATTVGSLEKKGLVVREVDHKDRRRVLITITDEGRKRAQREMEEIDADLQATFHELGKNDTEDLTRILERLFEILTSIQVASDENVKDEESKDSGVAQ